MNTIVKRSLLGLAGVTAVCAAGLVILPMVVDPNQFKGEITQQVHDLTGRELTIQGSIGLTLFPWAGLTLNGVTLGNAPGFGQTPMAKVEVAVVRVKLLPLLSQRMVVDRVILKGLDLNLAKDKKGHSNWADLSGAKTPDKDAPPPEVRPIPSKDPGSAPPISALAINGIDIERSNVSWRDESKGSAYAVRDLTLSTGPIASGDPVDVKLSLALESKQPAMQAKIALQGRAALEQGGRKLRLSKTTLTVNGSGAGLPYATLDLSLATDLEGDLEKQLFRLSQTRLEVKGSGGKGGISDLTAELTAAVEVHADQQHYRLDQTRLVFTGSGPMVTGGKLEATMTADLEADLEKQTLALTKMDLKGLDQLHLTGALSGTRILEAPAFSGEVKLDAMDLRALLTRFGVALPAMADAKALTHAALSSHLKADGDSLELNKLELALDGSTFNGSAGVSHFAKPAIRFDLTGSELDLDRYLPPKSSAPSAGGKEGGAAPAPTPGAEKKPVDLKPLRELDLHGALKLARFKVADARMSDVSLKINAKGGLIQVDPLDARLYDGTLHAKASLDARGETPVFTLDKELKGVQTSPLLKEVAQSDLLAGVARIQTSLKGRGLDADTIKRSLNGTLSLALDKGEVHGIDVPAEIRNAYSLLKGKPELSRPVTDKTAVQTLSAAFTIKDGVVSGQDLKALSEALNMTGAGSFDLPGNRIDYLLKTRVLGALEGLGDKTVEDLKGVEIPVRIQGTLSKPTAVPDLAGLLESAAKTETKKKLEEKLEQKLDGKLGQKLEEKLGKEGKEQLQKDLGGALQNILKF